MPKKIIFWLIIFVINLFFVIVVGEIYARLKHGDVLFYKAQAAVVRRPDFELDHSFIPNTEGPAFTKEFNTTYRINSLGLRDREYSVEKEPGAFRILALGDSFTEGHGVTIEHTYVKILEKKLNEAPAGNLKYEFINCGVSSYSPLLEYLFLKLRGLRLEPDMVVLFYNFNDLKDDCEYETTTVFDENGVPQSCHTYKRIRAYSSNPIEKFLVRHSRFYVYIENKINKKLYKLRYKDEKEAPSIERFIAYKEGKEEFIEMLWEKNKKYLGLIDDMLRERGISFVIVNYPAGIEISPVEWGIGRKEWGFEVGKVYNRDLVLNLLRQFVRERGISFIDVFDDFRNSKVFPLYFEIDGHFNENGHAFMAEAVFGRLVDMVVRSRLKAPI